MKKLILLLFISLLFNCDNRQIDKKTYKSANKQKRIIPISLEINKSFEENLIKKGDIKINVPANWKVLGEDDKKFLINSFNEISQYKLKSDFILTLSNSEINSYPNISVLIQKDYELTKFGINEFAEILINSMDNSMLTILDGFKGVITDHNDIGNYIDKKNQILYIINDGIVANVGRIKTIAAIILKKEYIISITLNSHPEEFKKFKSALQIMANSTRI